VQAVVQLLFCFHFRVHNPLDYKDHTHTPSTTHPHSLTSSQLTAHDVPKGTPPPFLPSLPSRSPLMGTTPHQLGHLVTWDIVESRGAPSPHSSSGAQQSLHQIMPVFLLTAHCLPHLLFPSPSIHPPSPPPVSTCSTCSAARTRAIQPLTSSFSKSDGARHDDIDPKAQAVPMSNPMPPSQLTIPLGRLSQGTTEPGVL